LLIALLAFVAAGLSETYGLSSTPMNVVADAGYNLLYTSNNLTVERTCMSMKGLPHYLNGTWLIPSVGQFEMGEYSLGGLLDGFGKFNKFEVYGETLCFSSRMMSTGFYNWSKQIDRIAPEILFVDTIPQSNFSGTQMLGGANDNTFVNSYQIDGQFFTVTDTPTVVEFNMKDLSIISNVTWKDSIDSFQLSLGSAHPIKDPESGCFFNAHPQTDILGIGHNILLIKICPGAPSTRVLVNKFSSWYLNYYHSWGLSPNYAVFLQMHFSLEMSNVMQGNVLAKCFKGQDMTTNSTTVTLLPRDGSAAIPFQVEGIMYFTHSVNTYEDKDQSGNVFVVYDFVNFEHNPFITAELRTFRTPELRNNQTFFSNAITRLILYTEGPKKGQTDASQLSVLGRSTDFSKINENYHGKKYCFYYAVEWFHDQASYGSMAVVKQNVCTGARLYWYQPSAYPSEPTFVADPAGTTEDAGSLLITLLDGTTGNSWLLTLDAATMTETSKAELPTRITFTTHGEFYPGVL
jgi:carotenoid cleavage dioxygenase-like enzyme